MERSEGVNSYMFGKFQRGVNSDIYGKFFMLCFNYFFGAQKANTFLKPCYYNSFDSGICKKNLISEKIYFVIVFGDFKCIQLDCFRTSIFW